MNDQHDTLRSDDGPKLCPKCKVAPYNPEDPFGLCADCGEEFEAEENERNLDDESTRGIVG